MIRVRPPAGGSVDALWSALRANEPAGWGPEGPGDGAFPAERRRLRIPLSTARVGHLLLLRTPSWVGALPVPPEDGSPDPLTDDDRLEVFRAWGEASVRPLPGARVDPDPVAPVEAAAARLQGDLGLHHSDLAVLIRGLDRAAVLHPVAGAGAMDYGRPSGRVPETQSALEKLALPAEASAAVAALSAVAEAHRNWTPGPALRRVPAEVAGRELLDRLSSSQRSVLGPQAGALLDSVGPGPWFVADRRRYEGAVQLVALRPALAVVLDLEGDGP